MSQFDFRPIHRMYSYIDGSIPARTIIVLEINLPSGIKADMVDVKIDEDGNSVRLELQWPQYMLSQRLFNLQWVKPLGDGSLRMKDSKMAQSQSSVQNLIRSYGTQQVKSTSRFKLPRAVETRVGSVQITKLAFIDSDNGSVKSNGFAI